MLEPEHPENMSIGITRSTTLANRPGQPSKLSMSLLMLYDTNNYHHACECLQYTCGGILCKAPKRMRTPLMMPKLRPLLRLFAVHMWWSQTTHHHVHMWYHHEPVEPVPTLVPHIELKGPLTNGYPTLATNRIIRFTQSDHILVPTLVPPSHTTIQFTTRHPTHLTRIIASIDTLDQTPLWAPNPILLMLFVFD